jgi:hypothetical protein
MARYRRNLEALAVLSLVLATASCGGQPGTPTSPAVTAPGTTAKPATPAPATPRITDEPPAALELLWEATGDTPVTGPNPGTYSPAVDPLTGDIWVAVPSEDILWIFSKDGEFERSFGKPGDGPGEFELTRPACRDCPGAGALAFAPDGSLFVADVGNHRVQKFDPTHAFDTEWGGFGAGEGQFADALQIATNGREVFVADDARRDLQVFDMEGAFLRTYPVSGWLAVDAEGSLLVSGLAGVKGYGSDGTPLEKTIQLPAGDGWYPIGLAVDAGGRLFFNLQNEQTAAAVGLGELDPTTRESRFWSTGGETLAIAGDIMYQANYTGLGWPKPVLRAYALPE